MALLLGEGMGCPSSICSWRSAVHTFKLQLEGDAGELTGSSGGLGCLAVAPWQWHARALRAKRRACSTNMDGVVGSASGAMSTVSHFLKVRGKP